MSIPKKIHYCWFGKNEKPDDIKKYIKTWDILDGYEIIEWNEENTDLSQNKYLYENYRLGRYAFVSDYVRLKVLYEEGGIYFDTDVEVFKNLSDKFLENSLFLSFMFDCNLSTAIIGCEKNNPVIGEIIKLYENLDINDSPNNDLFTNFMLENYKEFKLNNTYQKLDDNIGIYPKEFFECPTKDKDKGYTMHHFNNSWIKKSKIRRIVKGIMQMVLGEMRYHQNMRYRAIKKSPFYNIYIEHKKVSK